MEKWSTNQDTMWAYDVEAGFSQTWPLPENLIYTNETYKTAAMGGFPLGDLYHWWNPEVREGAEDHYSAWLAQADEERAKIDLCLETGQPTSIRSISNQIPEGFALEQNYPNPFNPTTNIEYTVPKTQHVSLTVYNELGQKVATIYDGMQKPGKYLATFNASELASGIYFYKLKSGSTVITKKLVLLK
jgi:hypothetical protein